MNSRQFLGAAACAAALAVTDPASALTLTLDGPGHAAPGDEVTVSVRFSNVADLDEVVVFHDIFVAFDDTVLAYKGIDFSFSGIVSPAGQGDPFYQRVWVGAPNGDYQNPPANDPPDHPWTYDGTDYGQGSVRVFQYSNYPGPSYAGLLSGGGGWSGQSLGFTAFALNFEVIAQSTLATTLALIDDTSYVEHTTVGGNYYDYKVGDGLDSWYPAAVVTYTFDVAEAPVAFLIGLGLVCLGAVRRGRRVV